MDRLKKNVTRTLMDYVSSLRSLHLFGEHLGNSDRPITFFRGMDSWTERVLSTGLLLKLLRREDCRE